MEKNSRKEKLVKQLLNRDFDVTDEDELIDLTKTSSEDSKEDVVEEIKPTKKEEQLSFDSFIDEFKI